MVRCVRWTRSQFEEALHLFKQCQAVIQRTRSRSEHAEYGAVMHNIASCLHCLGQFDDAKGYYEQAVVCFESASPSRLWVALYGDVDQRRAQFARERLIDLEYGRKPDLDKYLDGYGKKQQVTPDLAQPPPRAAEAQHATHLALGGLAGLHGTAPIGFGSPVVWGASPRAGA